MLRFTLILSALLLTVQSASAQIPKTISYQGVLMEDSGNPVEDTSYKLHFELHTMATSGQVVWQETHENVPVFNGIFNVILGSINPLDFPFNTPLFLGISVNDGPPLLPFTPLTASPYALGLADSVVLGSKIAPGQVMRTIIFDADSPVAITDSLTIQPGENIAFDIDVENRKLIISSGSGSSDGGNSWHLTGNSGTDTTNFIGTTDEQPLEFRVNNARVLRIEPTVESEGPNVVAGSYVNSVNPGVVGATISGGGDPSDASNENPNRVTARFGTVGGGAANTAGHDAVVAGGFRNSATGTQSTVGGGFQNSASGVGATVPGGSDNRATGRKSFAAGNRAKALHDGTFVWSSHPQDYESTTSNQFLINASGGVGINTNVTPSPLTVAGFIESTSGGIKFPDGTIQASAKTGSGDGHSLDASDGNPGDVVFVDNSGKVGIGTTTPKWKLELKEQVDALNATNVDVSELSVVFANQQQAVGKSIGLGFSATSITIGAAMVYENTGPGSQGKLHFATKPTITFEEEIPVRMTIEENGEVGIGTTNPQAMLDVTGRIRAHSVYARNATATQADVILAGNDGSNDGDDGRISSDPAFKGSDIYISSNDAVIIELDKDGSAEDADFEVRDRDGKILFNVDDGGNATLLGTLTERSDRNAKTAISSVNTQAILERVASLPISTWEYKKNPGFRHIGPMAQDFHATFSLGADETSISTIDRDGVALAAIQGLNQLLQEKDNKIAELEARLTKIEAILHK